MALRTSLALLLTLALPAGCGGGSHAREDRPSAPPTDAPELPLDAPDEDPAEAAAPVEPPVSARDGLDAADDVDNDPRGWESIAVFEGVPVTTVREFWPSGRLARIACSKKGGADAGTAHGPEWTFFENGGIRIRRQWVGGVLHGSSNAWFKSGRARSEGEYWNGERHGCWKRYNEEGGLRSSKDYVRGKPHGTFREWYKSGAERTVTQFADGLRSGTEREYGRAGQVLFERHYKAGALDGSLVEYHADGATVKLRGQYQADEKVGTWIAADATGHRIQEERFVAGLKHGLETRWLPDGTKVSEVTYSAGERTGLTKGWYADGSLQMEGELVNGQREGRWTYWRLDGTVNESWTGTYESDVKVSGR
ncbi:MAG: toxin-antitoxin system YwqK family antitoxin [Planctomycetota bacterium]|nr:MAG: toxin-antitoxin system YwqK family antitoxin [Planctomycetota bacterium]